MSTDSLAVTGRVGSLTKSQESILETFKTELQKEGTFDPTRHDDYAALRFLRARKFNLEAAKKMWTDKEKWVAEYGAADIHKTLDFPEYPLFRKYYPRYYHKTDKLGRPIYVELIGAMDLKQLLSVSTTERMMRYHVYEYEKLLQYRLPACSLKAGRQIEQSLTILDFNGAALSQFSSVYSIVSEVSTIAQNYYPEMLGKMYIINAPMLFTAVWTLVKQLLDEVTVSKIEILGYNYKDALLQAIDAENLPVSLGGTSDAPGGIEMSDIGPWSDGSVPGYPKAEFEKVLVILKFIL